MNKIDKTLKHAEDHCRERGARLTDKRKQVLSGLLKSGKALSAYELVDVCKAEFGSSIPTMSVYRILDFLEEEELVHKLHTANKYVACTHITCDHDHEVSQFLICGECQQVTEVGIAKATMKTLQSSAEKAGYHMLSQQIEMNCICKDCLKKKNSSA